MKRKENDAEGERQEITVIVERREGNDRLYHVIYFNNQSLERDWD
jgi:hypothetical protein